MSEDLPKTLAEAVERFRRDATPDSHVLFGEFLSLDAEDQLAFVFYGMMHAMNRLALLEMALAPQVAEFIRERQRLAKEADATPAESPPARKNGLFSNGAAVSTAPQS